MMRLRHIMIAVMLSWMLIPVTQWQGAMASVQAITDLQTRSITMNMGLPSNAVRNIVQDKDGFMWFGTDNGLCRYDGYAVQLFTNPYTKLDQYVCALASCDEGLLVGTTHGAYLFSYSTGNFQLVSEKITSAVSHISVDGEHKAWISTNGQGLFRYNLSNHECKQYPGKALRGNFSATLIDTNNQIWALSFLQGGGLVRLNKSTDAFEQVKLHGDATMLDGMALLAMPDGSILVGTWDQGLFQVSADGNVKLLLSASLTNVVKHIHQLYGDRLNSNNVYIGSDDGLVKYNLKEHTWYMLSEVNNPKRSTAERFVYSIAGDQEGGLWVGTFYGGVNYIPPQNFEDRFTAYYAGDKGLRGNVVGRFIEDAQHRIWIATDDAGLECYNPAADAVPFTSNPFIDYPGRSVLAQYNVHGLLAEGNYLWVGTYGNGIIKMDMSTGNMKTYQTDAHVTGSNCYCLYRDSQHRLWASSLERMNLWDEQAQVFKPFGPIKACAIDIEEDKQGNVWFATQGSGLWCYRKNHTWKQYLNVENDSTSIGSDEVNCVRCADKGILYVATNDGLWEYQPASDHFRRIQIQAPSQEFMCIISYLGELWLSSTKGIVRYMAGEPTQVFNRYDGLTSDQFVANSGLMTSDGRIYFGTTQGFNAFNPYQVKINQVQPPVAITSIRLFNQDDNEEGHDLNKTFGKMKGDETTSLPKVLNHVEEIGLKHDENMFNISFAALSYISPEKNMYCYKLEGVDKDWILTNEHRATYTNLPAGTYTFRVKAANNDGVWSQNEATLRIVVNPPFWWSLPAKLLYLLIIGYVIYWITQSRLKREKRRHQRQLDELEAKQEQEIKDARLRFFTMIAHEIRTPVTLIIGPLENLKEQWKQMMQGSKWESETSSKEMDGFKSKEKNDSQINKTLDVIDRNAQRLLLLVNQLLDFSKVQQKGMQVHFKLYNISNLLHAVAERFEPTFRQRGICFEVEYPTSDFAAIIDNEAITKVVSNLMTNANKYTNDFVRLSCHMVDADHFAIEVKDNGMGVNPEEQQKIFGAFYQARDNKPGTGIGLNIVKSLVDAHHGKVEVESKPGEGALFRVTLPINQPDVQVEKTDEKVVTTKIVSAESVHGENAKGNQIERMQQPTLLIVDDDEDMRQFVKANFEHSYKVLTAEDGKQALAVLQQHEVSMIISDWMMPEMDGPEFCRQVRKNPDISHLPFVMLTAKTDDASKTEGMNCGADIYIEKPFSMKYLEASVRNLIEMRRLLLTKYSTTPLEPITEIAPSPVDNKFLEDMEKAIEENITNPELNVAFLASQLGMSRSSLFNKIRGLADVTPNEMIQLVKLKRGARLLKEGQYRISEVSYMCGFSSPSYFAKCFQKQFGVKPMDFAEQ